MLVGGVTVSNASLHNQDEIDRKDLRPGDGVLLDAQGRAVLYRHAVPSMTDRVISSE